MFWLVNMIRLEFQTLKRLFHCTCRFVVINFAMIQNSYVMPPSGYGTLLQPDYCSARTLLLLYKENEELYSLNQRFN